MIALSEFKEPGWTTSYSYSRSFIYLRNLFHFTTAGYASELLHFICQSLIFLQNWSRLAACAGRTYIHWLAVSVLQGSILFVSLLSAIILFGSAHLFIHWTNHLCRSFRRNLEFSRRSVVKEKIRKKGQFYAKTIGALLIIYVPSSVCGSFCFSVFTILWIYYIELLLIAIRVEITLWNYNTIFFFVILQVIFWESWKTKQRQEICGLFWPCGAAGIQKGAV